MRIESDILKTAAVVALILGVYGGVVFWPSQKQNQALADEILNKQAQLDQAPQTELEPVRGDIASLRAELRERNIELPQGDLHDRILQHISDILIEHNITLYETTYRQPRFYKRFAVTPIDVSFETNFASAFEVIKKIEHEDSPIRVERLDIVGDEDDTSGQVQVTVELSSFFAHNPQQGDKP